MQTVAVIGISGYVGAHVAAALLARGISVRGTVRRPNPQRINWIRAALTPLAAPAVAGEGGARASLTLHEADADRRPALAAAMATCDGVIMCAGSPRIEPETISLMVALAENVCDVALRLGIPKAVFTSSTGSTNPPEGELLLKNEVEHWSDDAVQLQQKKYAAVGKTRLDRIVAARAQQSQGTFTTAVINPSMITGPAFQPDAPGSLRSFAAILNGERFAEHIPNGSMSMIDVRDLAQLHVEALLRPDASGRYFGVRQSWHWRTILAALERAAAAHDIRYAMPPVDSTETPVRATAFDLTRQQTLGVAVRDLDELLRDHVGEIKRRGLV